VILIKNITINIPENYDENIQKLIKRGKHPSRSEILRIAIKQFLQRESENLKLLNFSKEKNEE